MGQTLRNHVATYLCRSGLACHWVRCSEELVTSLTWSCIWESRNYALQHSWKQHSGAGTGGRDVGMSVAELTLTEGCLRVFWTQE